jgi:transposase
VRLRAGLTAGDPSGEVAVAWQDKELLRTVDAASNLAHARAALGRLLPLGGRRRGGGAVPPCPHHQGLRGRDLAFHATGGCSNGSTEAVNLLIKQVKRVGHGFRNFANYRLRLRLHCGVRWQTHRTARRRGRSARLVA